MKKTLALLTATALLISLVACGKETSSANNNSSAITSSATTSGSSAITDEQSSTPQSNAESEPTTSSESNESETPSESTESTKPESNKPQSNKPTSSAASDKPATTLHKHSYTSKVTAKATCGKDGVKTFTCSCGDSYTESIKATGQHSWGEWVTTKKPTQSVEGNSQRKCSVCNKTENKSIAKLPAEGSKITSAQIKQIEDEFLRLVNQERALKGANALKLDADLDKAAEIRGEELLTLFDHQRPNGKNCFSAIDTNDYFYKTAGENICYTAKISSWTGSATQTKSVAEAIFNLFKDSPGHYSNMINNSFKDCGIGIAYSLPTGSDRPTIYLAHMFGTRL